MLKTMNERQNVLASALGLQPGIFDGSRHAVIQLDGAMLHLQCFEQERSQVAVMLAQLGRIADKARLPAYALLLSANSSWKSVAGGALALDDTSGHAILTLRLDLTKVDDEELAQHLYAFIDAAETWSDRLVQVNEQAAAISPSSVQMDEPHIPFA